MKYIDFEDKNIIVVGGTNGIGLCLVQRLIELKANIIVLGRNIDKPELKKLKDHCQFFKCDISNSNDIDNTFDHIKNEYKVLHFAVNNAGITAPYSNISELDIIQWKKIIDTNLTGTAHCLKREIQLISQSKGGAIVNISSCAGLQALRMQAAYSVSKAAINMLTQVAAIECAVDHDNVHAIRVNAVAPGPILGGMNNEENLRKNPERTERKLSITAMKKFGTADEVANSVLWLLSQQSSYTTGVILPIDGGFNSGKFN
ncbi:MULTISPECIES: SDR family NAD(P)-dependent oxidoreductase [unclassified Gilliamella]|jgi:NAD(P)-dependent dehydrogenase (short-subunit alcohol dehydrogenase family)|uniref:SDR family NAD(P)-dependent oxidoreductase n=1 Tax=unclassified Gilliamella TaxID=2685620 RepID=UPI0004DD3305|nr:SDR family oxidoreductase [Gilliamella apicola]KFA59211.1 glucose-1-dehydrogenase [Gilliamella apicola]